MSKSKRPRQSIRTIFKNNFVMLRSVARHTPDYFLLMIAEGIIWGCINSAASVFSYKLLNAVDDGTDFTYAASAIGCMAVFYLLAYAFDKWYWCIRNPLLRKSCTSVCTRSCLPRPYPWTLLALTIPSFITISGGL